MVVSKIDLWKGQLNTIKFPPPMIPSSFRDVLPIRIFSHLWMTGAGDRVFGLTSGSDTLQNVNLIVISKLLIN